MTRNQLANYYLQELKIPLRPTKIIEQINERIGPLSNPSKMPCHSWDIPASLCKTGGKLSKIEGTPCSKCYALKGRFRFPNVEQANQRRIQGYLEDPDWILLMTIRLLKQRNIYFRWFSSGDLQSPKMLESIIWVCLLTSSHIKHWLPTQERNFIKEYAEFIPENLCVRISSTKLEQIQHTHIPNAYNSSVSAEHWTCPSHLYGNTCGGCRACWDRNTPLIIYRLH